MTSHDKNNSTRRSHWTVHVCMRGGLDSSLLAMNFLDLIFVLCNAYGICNTAEYIECRILQSVFEKIIAVAK